MRVAAGEGLREVARAAGASERPPRAGGSRALVPIRGFLHRDKSALRPPHPFPRPGKPWWRRVVHPSAPPDNALQLPTSEGDPARGMPGHGRPEGAGRPAAPASTSHLSDARPGAVPHGFLQPLVALAPGGGEEPEPAPEPKPERAGAGGGGGAGRGAGGGKEERRRSEGRGRAPGRAGPTAEGAAPAAVSRLALSRALPETRSAGPPARPLGALARLLAAALTHIPSIPEELLGGWGGAGAGTRPPPRGAAESARPGRDSGAGVFVTLPPRRPLSRSISSPSPVPDAPSRLPSSKSCQALGGLVRWLQRQGQG